MRSNFKYDMMIILILFINIFWGSPDFLHASNYSFEFYSHSIISLIVFIKFITIKRIVEYMEYSSELVELAS